LSPKIFAFSAQVITVRGLITVLMSPAMKPARVRSARATIASTRFFAFASPSWPSFFRTISVSIACGR
jgi:hypothetical protein